MNSTTATPSPSLGRQLYTMTWPMLFGVLSLMSFQLVDSAFIGQLGVLPLAVQGFTLPIQMIIIGVQVGLGIATTAVIARAIGANEIRYAKQLGGLVVAMGSISVALFSVIIYLLRGPILQLLDAPPTVLPIIDSYWIYWLMSSWTGALLYFFLQCVSCQWQYHASRFNDDRHQHHQLDIGSYFHLHARHGHQRSRHCDHLGVRRWYFYRCS